MHASAAQEPETRGGGQSPSGVFNPPPREVRTEQSVSNPAQELFKIVKNDPRAPRPRYVPENSTGVFLGFRGQLRPKTAQDGLKIAQDGLKIGR